MANDCRMSQVIVPKAFTKLPADADKATVIRLLTESLAAARKIRQGDVDTLIDGALNRETMGSTGIGHGIAIPHCKTPLVKHIVCAYGYSAEGVEFESLDNEPVYSVFFLLTPSDLTEQHLQLMKSFVSQIRKEHFCEFLHKEHSAESLISLLEEFEDQ